MAMFILLPNKRTGLAQLEADLKNVNIPDLCKTMQDSRVTVSLPKFRIEFEISLVDALSKVSTIELHHRFAAAQVFPYDSQMGMREMFAESADFSGLLETTDPVHISDVVHKAYIDVNEKGAEAAAATGKSFAFAFFQINSRAFGKNCQF